MLAPGRRTLLHLASLAALASVDAAPTISFPINSQVPPVARISQPFSYVFSSSTFTSSSGSPLFYTLKDPPPWLSIDSASRRLYGTPHDADIAPGTVVGVPITLVATDSTGGSTPLSVTLVVSRNPGPAVQLPVSAQIRKFGAYSEPSSILFYPDGDFLFAFAPDTFEDAQTQSLNYYAVTADNSPLPAWVTFDQGSLAFSGTTPPFASLIEPPQTFPMKLIASDIKGFSAASVDFSIVVGSHALTVAQPRITLNATAGVPLSYTGLIGSVKIDDQPVGIVSNVLRATTQNLPSWLVLDPASWAIAGTPPHTAQSSSFSVILEDDFADRLNITFDVEFEADMGVIFHGDFPTIDLETGDQLYFDLKPFLSDPTGSEITTDVQPPTSWIQFDASKLVLTGDVPTSAPSSVIEIVFNARAQNGLERDEMLQSQRLTIQVMSILETTTASSGRIDPASSTVSAAATSSNTTPGDPSAHNTNTNVVLIAVLVPIIVGLLFGVCFCFCWYRRRQRRLSRTPLEGKDSAEPSGYVHTQGYDSESTRLDLSEHQFAGFTSSPAEKSKPRKPSNLRSEYTGSPVPEAPPPALPIIVHDAPTQDALPSKYRDLMAPLRNFRIPRLKRGNTRTSSDSFDEDDGRGFSMDHPPSITLRQSRQNSFRSEVEVSIPSLEAEHSPVQSPDAAYTGSTARPSGNSGHYYAFPSTPPADRGPPPRDPARGPSELGHSRDITPVDQSELIIEKTRPAAENEPRMREHPALRHAKSQKSFLSFSSVDTFRGTRKLAGKATASAKGAASLASAAVQRKTLKAWGKVRLHVQDSPHARQGIFGNVSHNQTDFRKYSHFGGSGGYMSLRDPGVPATVPTPRVATAPVALNSESHRRRQSRITGSCSSDDGRSSSRALSVGAGEDRTSRSDPGTVIRRGRRRGSGSYDNMPPPQLSSSPRGSYMGLGIAEYEGLLKSSPFHPSRDSNRGRAAVRPTATTTSWATTQARLSGASSMDRPFTAKTTQTFSSIRDSRNWVVHQVSPMESPMENRLESPVLPSAASALGGPLVVVNNDTAGERMPTRPPPAAAARGPVSSSSRRGDCASSGQGEIKRKSVPRSGRSVASGESDRQPAFI